MARLLSPVDFGLFAMVMTAAGLLRVFKDAGLATVTVQREEITREQVSNLFWILRYPLLISFCFRPGSAPGSLQS